MTDQYPRPFGKYFLLAPLAQGGMGALYLAAAGDRELQKLCVIKTVLPHLADAEYLARFRDEAKVVVRLSHGNLVPVWDAGQVGDEMFLAMEFVAGKDLRAVWNRCAKKAIAFPIDVAVFMAKELARGLHYAHTFGDIHLVHRDVSPPNVLVSYSGEVKLTDFGLATSTLKLEKTAPGVVYGKVSYMSPEQARGEPLDGRTDVYAAGIILWELLTGRQLFPATDAQPQDLIARCRDPQVEPPSQRAPRVPRALDPIVLKALTADRTKRYQSAEEFRAALAGYLGREAPATDTTRVGAFLRELFAEDIETERKEREAQLAQVAELLRNRTPSRPHPRVATPVPLRQPVITQPETPSARIGGAGSPTLPATPTPLGTATAPRVVGSPGRVPPARADGSTVMNHDGAAAALAVSPGRSDADPILGVVVAERYKVLSLIGEGGMGRVYAAEHTEIGKRVALKILHPVYSRMPEVVERFRREARAASKIGHPNIVDVTDSGTTLDGSVFFVMEYLEGVELAEVIDREGALAVPRAVNITVQICRALAAAHAAGIIHRDLKPENVFLVARDGSTDFVKVLDFGIAKSAELEEKRAERLTSPGMAMGTPEYMAPEQAAGRPADARADIYATGAIFYEMLTGVPPYEGENFMEILTKKATQAAAQPRSLRPDIPDDVERLVMSALARDPDERPQTMESFEYELTKCLAGRGAAVAKILGMPLEAGVGFSQEAAADGITPTPPPTPRPRTMPQTPMPTATPASAVEPPAKGRRSSLPLVLLALVIVGAGGGLIALRVLGGATPVAPVAAVQTSAKPIRPTSASPATGTHPAHPGAIVKNPAEETRPERHVKGATTHDEVRDQLADCNKDIAQLRLKQADTCFHEVLATPFEHAAALYGLAESAFNDGRMNDAVKFANASLKAGGGDDSRVLLGDAYLRQGKTADAIRLYKLALAHNPANQRARAGLAAAQRGR